jgi:nitrite reductase/ring-hydroxylating ferredoxin subunit
VTFLSFVDVTKIKDIPARQMKHFEVGGNEILILNVGGKFFAVGDRCGHMNSPFSLGRLDGNIITCPLHFARFDFTNGKLVSCLRMSM